MNINKIMHALTKICIIITLTQILNTGACIIQDNTWYIGNKFGFPKYYKITTYANIYNTLLNNTYGSIHNSHLSIGSFLGYIKNQHLHLEIGYNYLGYITYISKQINTTFTGHNIDLCILIQHPINNQIKIYTKFGGAIWHVINKNVYISTKNYCLHTNDTSLSPLMSLGIIYTYNSHWSTKLDCQKINNIGNINNVGAQSNHAILSLSIQYHFI